MSSDLQSPIFSTLSSDPDMLELVEEFVANLQNRIRSIEEAVAADDLQQLTTLAHQLKGASGGYGFDPLSQQAARLEQAARASDSIQQVTTDVNELVAMCRRATAEPAS